MEQSNVQCQVCARTPDSSRGFFCKTCARNVLYQPRIENAALLIGKESLAKEIEQAVIAGSESEPTQERKNDDFRPDKVSVNRIALERAQARQSQSKTRTESMLEETENLRADIKKRKEEITKKKANIIARRAAIGSATGDLARLESQNDGPLKEEIALIERKWSAINGSAAEVRIILCKEVATLYGLQQRKRKKGAPGRDIYLIGGVPIVDLRDLNSKSLLYPLLHENELTHLDTPPQQISASITSVAHLLYLTSNYLSLRLPAEIVLPSATQPYTVINTPLSSHKSPSNFSAHKYSHSSTARQRILHLDKALLTLAAEDAITYSLFVDATTLLAWDIAWLAKTQGIEVGLKSWEEVCALGKNMWVLFGPSLAPGRPPIARASTATTNVSSTAKSSSTAGTVNPPKPALKHISGLAPGYFTHNSSHSFLAAAGSFGGVDLIRGWQFSNPIRLIERIKSALYSERMGAEWEVLEKNEWEEGDEEGGGGAAAAAADKDQSGKDKTTTTRAEVGREEDHFLGFDSSGRDMAKEARQRDAKSDEAKGMERPKRGWTKLKTQTYGEPEAR